MRRYPFIYIVIAALPLVLASCGGGEDDLDQAIPVATPPPRVAPPAEAEKPMEPLVPVEGVLRNPFQTYIVAPVALGDDDDYRKGPLECCPLERFNLLAVVAGVDDPRALVLAPDGKRYIVKTGDRFGDKRGVISRIEGRELFVKEKVRDDMGQVVDTVEKSIGLPMEREGGG
ncbi:MAG: pilus assembly protein PilP [Thermodesulfobacteriota bacterium]